MFLDREGENPPQEIATWPRNLAADLLQVQHPPKNEQVPVAESRPQFRGVTMIGSTGIFWD
jgi:hypothetical protein